MPGLESSNYYIIYNHRGSPAVSDDRSVFRSLLLTPQGSVALKKSNGYYREKCMFGTLNNALRRFKTLNIDFVKIALQMLDS